MRYMYPAIFTCKRDKHMIVADFPDIAGCRAYGHTMEEYLGGLTRSGFAITGYLECQGEDITALNFLARAVRQTKE